MVVDTEMQQTGIPRALKVVAIGIGAVVALLLLRELPFDKYGLALLRAIEGWGPLAPLVCILIYIIWVLLMLPGSVMTIGAGILFGKWGMLVAVLGGMASSTAAFLVARYFARGRVHAWAARSDRARVLDRAMREGGWGVIFLSRLSPVIPYNVTNYFFGITCVSFRTYLTATFVGMLPGTLLYAYAGSLGHEILLGEHQVTWVHYTFLGGGLLATGALGLFLQKKLQHAGALLRDEASAASSHSPDQPGPQS